MNMNNPRIIILIGAAAVIIGSFMPWATLTSFLGDINKNGTEGDGAITLVMGILIGLAAVFSKPRSGKRGSWVAVVLGVLVGLIAIIDIADIERLANDVPFAEINVGIGLYVVLIGAVIAVVGGLIQWPVTDTYTAPSTTSANLFD